LVLKGNANANQPALGCLYPGVDDSKTEWPGSGMLYDRIAAQCCTGGSGANACRRNVPGSGCVAGTSTDTLGGLIDKFTYAENEEFCTSKGLFMCEQSCKGRGCFYNKHPVFTSLPCNIDPPDPEPTPTPTPVPTPTPTPTPEPPSDGSCTNTCVWAFDSECDDGGPGAEYSDCELGSDCSDCGPRAPPPPSVASPPSPPKSPRAASPPPSDLIERCVTSAGSGINAGPSPYSAPTFSELDVDGKIVGGEEVQPERALQYQVSLGDSPFCGGSIIGDKWVLTAAHCLPVYTVKVGVHNQNADPLNCVQRREVKNTFRHPLYNSGTLDYDIAVLELKSPVDYAPIALNTDTSLESAGTKLTVSGWGRTSSGGPVSEVLLKVSVPVVATNECNQNYGGAITEQMICAGQAGGGKDSCQGDSGGPIVYAPEDGGAPVLVGIVSWGEGCALPNRPGVYTRVSVLADWVNEKMTGRRSLSDRSQQKQKPMKRVVDEDPYTASYADAYIASYADIAAGRQQKKKPMKRSLLL